MHTAHAGAVRQGLQWVFGVGLTKLSEDLLHRFSTKKLSLFDKALKNWRSGVPADFNRKPRKLGSLLKWKMRETYVVGTRILIAVLATEPHRHILNDKVDDISAASMTTLQRRYFDNYMNLVAAVRIVSSNSMNPIPPVSMQNLV
jgi:hypothetical protein